MKYFLLFTILNSLTVCFSFGQGADGELSTSSANCRCEGIASIDPTIFAIDTFVFRKEKPKTIKRRLKLGIQGRCIFVIDSLGSVQPYKIKNWTFTFIANGNASSSCIGNCIPTIEVMSILCNGKVSSRFFIDTIVVEDENGREIKGLVEPLTIVKIK